MKLYKVWVAGCGYDEYDAFIVAADSIDEIHKELAEKGNGFWLPEASETFDVVSKSWKYKEQPINIEIIGATLKYNKFEVVLGSFNAG